MGRAVTWQRAAEQRETYKGVVLCARQRAPGCWWLLEVNAVVQRRPEGGPRWWQTAAHALAAGRRIVDANPSTLPS